MCDASYLCQVDRLERETLSQISLLPHLEEEARKSMPSPGEVRDEFDRWLNEAPAEQTMTAADVEQLELFRLMGVAKGR